MAQDGVMTCKACGIEIPAGVDGAVTTPCPNCGGNSYAISFTATVSTHVAMDAKARRPGEKKPFREIRAGDSLTQRTGEWNDHSRDIDRDNNRYQERVVEKRTGEVLHEADEPLDRHVGHGDDKKNRPRRDK